MRGAAQDFDGMRQKLGDRVEGFDGAARRAGQIDDERIFADAGDGARERGARIFLRSLLAHELADAGQELVADGGGGFGSGVARADSRAAGGEHEINRVRIGERDEALFEGGAIVGDGFVGDHLPAESAAALSQGGPGTILALAAGDGLAHGNEGDAHGAVSCRHGRYWLRP